MSRYLLQRSSAKPDWFILTDTSVNLVMMFKKGRFNDTQRTVFLDDDPDVLKSHTPSEIAHLLMGMGDYVAQNHPDLI